MPVNDIMEQGNTTQLYYRLFANFLNCNRASTNPTVYITHTK